MRHLSFYDQKQGQQRRGFSKLSTGEIPVFYRSGTGSNPEPCTPCDELEGRNAREMMIHALFGFFTQQVVLFTCRTCTYIGVVTNERTKTEKVNPR
jgi:hypothetical protein